VPPGLSLALTDERQYRPPVEDAVLEKRATNRLPAALIALGLILCGCGKSREAAVAATEQFRARVGGGRYGEIYRDATTAFRDSATEPEFIKMMDAVAKKLGKFRSASPRGWNVNMGTAGRIVTLAFTSEFEKGRAVETFVWKGRGDEMALQGYNINSPALLTY
jgi:hypothetical protein